MKEHVIKIYKSPFFSGSLIMIAGTNFNNILNYIYHFLMGRILGPANYGDLMALFSLVALLGLIPASFSPAIVKLISSAKNEKEQQEYTTWFVKKAYIVSAVLVFVLIIASPFIANFIRINNIFLVVLMVSTFIFSLQLLLGRSVLQGIINFPKLAASILSETSLKIITGAILVFIGFNIIGAVVGVLISVIGAFLITRSFIRKFVVSKISPEIHIGPILTYSLPIALFSAAYTSFFSTDLIMVKHYFSSHEAGIYAAMSNFSKIILYGTGPIVGVMFPIIAKKHSKGEGYIKVFSYSLVLTSLVSLAALVIYTLVPGFIIGALYGISYIEGEAFLFKFGLLATLLTLASLFINFYISIGKPHTAYLGVIAALAQIVGIYIFHNSLLSLLICSRSCLIVFSCLYAGTTTDK